MIMACSCWIWKRGTTLNYADKAQKYVKVDTTMMNIVFDVSWNSNSDLGFIKRTEVDLTQSVSTIHSELLEHASTSSKDVNNALYGLISGLYAKQNVGWNAQASFRIRGNGEPLVLIDGFPRDLKNITLEAVESIQVLKDGAATALWGGLKRLTV